MATPLNFLQKAQTFVTLLHGSALVVSFENGFIAVAILDLKSVGAIVGPRKK